MADAEEPQFNTLAERIAALNKQKSFNGAGPQPTPKKRPPPPPPSAAAKPALPAPNRPEPVHGNAAQKTNPVVPLRPAKANPSPAQLQRRDTGRSSLSVHAKQNGDAAPRPPLPNRTNTASSNSSPALPPRRPSSQSVVNGRRNSGSSEMSQQSAVSSLSLGRTTSATTPQPSDGGPRRLPPVFDKGKLPPLPPSRREAEAKAQEAAANEAKSARNSVSTPQPTATSNPDRPGLPPRLPSRPAGQTREEPDTSNGASRPPPGRRQAPHGVMGFGSNPKQNGSRPPHQPSRQDSEERPPPMPKRRTNNDEPPPIPTTSRPSAAQIDAASARVVARSQIMNECWVCRDWSGPDNVAAQFPKQSLPRNDPVGHLARGLCDPFPSYTDKARAIFTWFHHNIFYDTVSFFNNDIKHKTVEETIFSGLAVCQGYAETYKAIANRAGLECVVVGGHGKGFGHSPLKKGERPPPPKPDGHAWNAVRIDGGEWKLLDACWGAGHLCGATNLYKQQFTPEEFIRPNEKFGLSHFPQDPQHQYRKDGRTVSWEEYFRGPIDGEPPTVYTNAKQEGIAEDSVQPRERQIPVHSGEVVRFQFSKICEHWTSEKDGLGKPPLLVLEIHGVDGRKDDVVPIQTDGYWHWVDVHARDLGAPGQTVQVSQVTSIGGKDARGVSAQEYLSKKGKTAMSWSGVMKWELV